MLEWQEETKIISRCSEVTLGHQGFNWVGQRCHRFFFMMIHSSHFMLWRHPHCTPRPDGGMQRRPARRPEYSCGPYWVKRSPRWSLRVVILHSKDICFDLITLFLSQVPSLKFHLFHPPVPHLSKGLRPAVQSAKFLQCSFQNRPTQWLNKAWVLTGH